MYLDDGISRESAPDDSYLLSALDETKTTSAANGVSNGQVSNGQVANGHGANGRVSNGQASHGQVSNGQMSNGRASNGQVASGGKSRQTDVKAASKFSKVVIKQVTKKVSEEEGDTMTRIHKSRTVSITCPFNGFKDGLSKSIGDRYTVVFWHDTNTPLESINVTTSWKSNIAADTNKDSRATAVVVPVSAVHSGKGVEITLSYDVPVKKV